MGERAEGEKTQVSKVHVFPGLPGGPLIFSFIVVHVKHLSRCVHLGPARED